MDDKSGRLKKKRGVTRTSVTKICKAIETELTKTDVNVDALEEMLEQLAVESNELKNLDSQIEEFVSDDKLEKEVKEVAEYTQKIITWKFRATKKIRERTKNVDSLNVPSSCYKESSSNIKLPKLSISKFYGQSSLWLSFWNSFESAIHENDSLSEVSKFNYLKAHLGGSALSTIEGFALTPENYEIAIKLLKERFGRSDVLINTHLNNLLRICPLKNSDDIVSFRKMFDNIQTEIRSLESLNVLKETYQNLLCPLLLKCLPPDLVLEYNKSMKSDKYEINELVDFLSIQLKAKERSLMYASPVSSKKEKYSYPRYDSSSEKINNSRCFSSKRFSSSDLISSEVKTKTNACIFCNEFHAVGDCNYVLSLSLEQRKKILSKKAACFICAKPFHLAKFCKSKIVCTLCGKRHLSILCNQDNSVLKNNTHLNENKDDNNLLNENFTLSNNLCSSEVYLQTLIVSVENNDLKHYVRSIIDLGSQRSYVSKYVADVMKLKCVGEQTVTHGLFGGLKRRENHKKYSIELRNTENNFSCNVEVMDQNKICTSLPKLKDPKNIEELKQLGIFASDICLNENLCLYENDPKEIHILLGADTAARLFTGEIKNLSPDLIAMNTKLGWTVIGRSRITENDSSSTLMSLLVNDVNISDLWRLDTLNINDPAENQSRKELEEAAKEHFERSVKRDNEGRYIVSLPWIHDHPPLPDGRKIAERRLNSCIKALERAEKLVDYDDVFQDWQKEGFIEEVDPMQEIKQGQHFLPHHPVFKENSTTKVRPVFDGSAKERNTPSINDCLEKGPNLVELIPSLMNRFRVGKYGVIADIKKAFLQIGLQERDRPYLRFLWKDRGREGNIKILQHKRVVFGISSSPFLLGATLELHLKNAPDHLKETAQQLMRSFYVDNCVFSVNTKKELARFISESQALLSTAKFELRGWEHSPTEDKIEERQEDRKVPVLGLLWNLPKDTMSLDMKSLMKEDKGPTTKRKILSTVHRIFDPIGFSCPVTLEPKCLLQECWKLGLSWDAELPLLITERFERWKMKLPKLNALQIPRVLEIRKLTNPEDWRHISRTLNPADLPSRGSNAEELVKSLWWEGPNWLRRPIEDWPVSETIPDFDVVNSEKRKTIVSVTNTTTEQLEYFSKVSSFRKMTRITAWIFRFYKNAKTQKKERKGGTLDLEEVEAAEKFILKQVQSQCFSGNEKLNLQTFLDSDGLLRVKTKISQRSDIPTFRFPILLPSKHAVIGKLIFEKHVELSHAGIQILMSSLRENYWILKSRKTIRQVIRTCVICQRFASRPLEVVSAPLPEDRVRDAYVFEVVGVDLCGPLYLKNKTKCWAVLFTCAVYRAVHIELVTSLSTDSFILALRRFISRRGRPATIYSDNGTNLVGTSNELKSVDWGKIQEYASVKKIQWKFNPPSAPWWGGFWERLIGMLKSILRKVLGKASLQFEELCTVLCDAEGIINSRPLTYLSEDNEDLVALTPAMFLQDVKEIGVPDIDQIDAKRMNKRFFYRQKLCQDLRKRFRIEYLGHLREFSKICNEFKIKEGDIVLIGDSNVKRINWPLGRVIKLYLGKDKKVRLVEIQTKSGSFLRPIQRLFPLEISQSEKSAVPRPPKSDPLSTMIPDGAPTSSDSPAVPDVNPNVNVCSRRRSRYGRLLKPSALLDSFI
ncbi:hypothetical protein AVEN_124292-1 [Araneus ventricosus]|uniref:Integrase catalytic domain-containing protein n=1 Tax=Araneus ventricosus TaxID=182803 RepID=A0A4Y2FWJ6_ARAVE|nr:hypothetical protein AVEN_88538-1 [Araneus ventricosus]GBM44044.1 hypothetical protein AVEN_124292-1 [Araneus ventricosus]